MTKLSVQAARFRSGRIAVAALLFATAAMPFSAARAQNSPLINIGNGDCVATDSLGRSLPSFAEVGPPRDGRWVGLFYFMSHRRRPEFGPSFDVTKYLNEHPGFVDWKAVWPGFPNHSAWYWAEPIYGYYQSADPWVIRRQLKLISAAGVDLLFVDCTNLEVYDEEVAAFLQEAADLKSEGVAVPRLVFFVNSDFEWKLEHIYTKWYLPGAYDGLWFRWQGKPLILSPNPENAAKFKDPSLLPTLRNYFTFRQCGWQDPDREKDLHRWRYADAIPQRTNLGPDGKVEQMVVNKATGGPIWRAMVMGGVSCVPGHVPEYDDRFNSKENAQGLFFQAEWDRALKIAPPMLFVTGWNEWIASIWERPGVVMLGRSTVAGQGYFVDEFNMDFNRDIEPMKGGYDDDYYWQFVANMRRYKGMLSPEAPSKPVKIKIDGHFEKWSGIRPVYRHACGSPAARDFDGAPPGLHYTAPAVRNQIVSAQVARDDRSVAFHVRTRAPLSAPAGRNWMLLLIKSGSAVSGWHGYDLLVNRTRDGKTCSVEANVGGKWQWRKIASISCRWLGNDLELALPRSLFPKTKSGSLRFEFKWADDLPDEPSIMDFYTQGDTAPDARFNYLYDAP